MSKITKLEARLDAAFARIEAALGERPEPGALQAMASAGEAQSAEIAALRDDLARIRAERRKDADDVSAILADLRPLLERS
ncbi:hypothetical protein FDP22_10305 [Paroceanicella profunda]|uniref:DUF4164 family protein n=1 Tax=Paroceanicella profunda TaxID=2579971 RepID=A0A5B8FHK3_9RHOB|nr:hypothetical protein [Paroceanicella profunda]QDL92128.1 hypothetical protein FDP22_10305 [Paroceanicella profunda]